MAEQKSNRVFLLVAVVLGVLATVTTFAYLESSGGRVPTRKVLAASHDLSPNNTIDPSRDFQELDIPISVELNPLYDRCLKPAQRDSYRNQRVNRRILAGIPVMFADVGAPLADLELRPGKMALGVPAKGAHAVSGGLVPGDMVKLYVTRPLRSRGAPAPAGGDPDAAPIPELVNRWETVLIAPEALRVLAVGGKFSRSRQQLSAAEQFEVAHEPEGQQSVTLEVTEAQCKTILQETGSFQLPIDLALSEKANPTTAPR